MDVSFISATLVLPAVIRAASSQPARNLKPVRRARDIGVVRQIVVLVKPQFEAGRELVGKGGIVRDESAQRAAVARVEAALFELGCTRAEWIESPILGGEGNREFLLHAVCDDCFRCSAIGSLMSGTQPSINSEVQHSAQRGVIRGVAASDVLIQSESERQKRSSKTCPSLPKAQLARKPLPLFRSRTVPNCAKHCRRSKNGCCSVTTR